MREVKDTKQATVHIGYDGRVHKTYHGFKARERYENEVRVLRYLEEKGCGFVPRLLAENPEKLNIITTNCGAIFDSISKPKMQQVFAELETYGVRHGDAFSRNITYSPQLGRFCVIDFEFATILETGEGLSVKDVERPRHGELIREDAAEKGGQR